MLCSCVQPPAWYITTMRTWIIDGSWCSTESIILISCSIEWSGCARTISKRTLCIYGLDTDPSDAHYLQHMKSRCWRKATLRLWFIHSSDISPYLGLQHNRAVLKHYRWRWIHGGSHHEHALVCMPGINDSSLNQVYHTLMVSLASEPQKSVARNWYSAQKKTVAPHTRNNIHALGPAVAATTTCLESAPRERIRRFSKWMKKEHSCSW